MPNLVHSLDGTSLSLLHEKFSINFGNNAQFFSVHDCFGTTCDKVDLLNTLLASVYTHLYSSDPYLYKFDKNILDIIESSTDYKLDRNKRELWLGGKNDPYLIHDIDWVTNQKKVSSIIINKIDSKFIII